MEADLAAGLAMLALDGHRLSYVWRRSSVMLSQARSFLPHLRWLLRCLLLLQKRPCHAGTERGVLFQWHADTIAG